jgi:hypothetical protein
MSFPRLTVAILAAAAVGLGVSGCGGSGAKTLTTAAQAEMQIRRLELQQCHVRLRAIHCRARGTGWLCSFSASGGGLDNGFVSLEKREQPHGSATVAC